MAISKTNTILAAALTSVGAGAQVSAAEWDMSALFSGYVVGKIINTTAPTTTPLIVFYAGESTGQKREIWRMGGDMVANSTTVITFRVPKEVKFLNITATGGNTTGSTWELMGFGFTGP